MLVSATGHQVKLKLELGDGRAGDIKSELSSTAVYTLRNKSNYNQQMKLRVYQSPKSYRSEEFSLYTVNIRGFNAQGKSEI